MRISEGSEMNDMDNNLVKDEENTTQRSCYLNLIPYFLPCFKITLHSLLHHLYVFCEDRVSYANIVRGLYITTGFYSVETNSSTPQQTELLYNNDCELSSDLQDSYT